MKTIAKIIFFIGLFASCNLLWADRIGGSPRTDFSSNELAVTFVGIHPEIIHIRKLNS